jgi:DNA-binding response OmpR family regulator
MSPVRILVVEDDPVVRHFVDAVLTRRGHNVLVASSAFEAAALLLDFPDPPDVALLDVMLPGMTGLVYSDHLVRQFPAIRLVFMTGLPDRPERVLAEARGVLLAKPFGVTALLAAISAVVG